MARVSPLRDRHLQAQASLVPYGPTDHPAGAVELVEAFGELELEYAALRKQAVLLDLPSRGVVEVRGDDRIPFINRMLTQELKDLRAFHWRPSFWLNRKGRIDADIRVIELGDRTLLEMDVHSVDITLQTLGAFIITEDVTLADTTPKHHRLALHGPKSLELLATIEDPAHHEGPAFEALSQGQACVASIAGVCTLVVRDDATGEIGLELLMPRDDAPRLADALTGARPIGWHAFNIARIEAGTPLYNIDFGPKSTPAETGLLASRVSFTKGCYLGQEVVARMHARGHSKQLLVAIRFDSIAQDESDLPRLPIAGALLTAPGSPEPVGAVASSTLSPMLGAAPIALAQVKPAFAAAGTTLAADEGVTPLPGMVQPSLVFWSKGSR
ncbi:MAG: aminomethyl transferase family protein [Phycisphaerales bacterium]|nr:aminomethyl transferase family protein [Phycisphaerales bacterium]